ncbi:MAG TPA: GTP-dependent dephospho-CoA kinase family protein [Candidatus Norongarragalinales archaeon]|nr:GTP-dependent dephospho-CoA kinase family protein [Candidatus Norongarragalinales archaeon]
MLRITPRLKLKLRKPLGRLFRPFQKKELKAEIEHRYLVAVGDATVLRLSEMGITPHVAVYDLRTRREPLPLKDEQFFHDFHAERLVCVNPAGYITESLEKVATRCLKNAGPVKLFVVGEEDLATLVFMKHAKTGVICYGQPGKGMVVVKAGSEAQETAEAFLRNFTKV